MNVIKVDIDNDSLTSELVSRLEQRLPESTKSTPEFQLLWGQITSSIDDLVVKASKFTRKGTSIRIEKDYDLPNVKIVIVLEYPKKRNLLSKISKYFGAK